MKTKNFKLDENFLVEDINFNQFKNEKNILIQIFSGENKEKLSHVLKEIKTILPQAVCISSSTDGEINNKEVHTNTTLISISTFEQTTLKSAYLNDENDFNLGLDLANKLIGSKTKLLIVFASFLNANAENFLKGISAVNNEVIVCGGIAANHDQFEQTYISHENEIYSNGCVAVALDSDVLEVKNDYRFNWSPIGTDHEITKVKDNVVYEVEGMNILDFYKKYLGENTKRNIIETSAPFPLLIEQNGMTYARNALSITEDKGLLFGANFKEGDRLRFGFANTNEMIHQPIIEKPEEYLNSESFFIYSCMARRNFFPNSIYIENSAYANIAPCVGFFTYGEFFHKNKKNILLNHTFTVISLSENPNKKNKLISNNESVMNNHTKTMQTLTHLIEQSSTDYDEQSQKLELEKINSQMLLTSQKIFLRHAVHETNTPISVIMSNIELYEMQYGKNEYLSNIEVALKNIFNIYDDLSYLVKKDQVLYPKKNIDIIDYIRARIEFFSQSAKQIGSEFIFSSPLDSLNINFNETKLQRIIDNNLTNAIKYTEEHSNIYVTFHEINKQYILTISSCSQYIQYPEKVFKEYYREESTKKGFGLGLSLVKRICDEEDIRIAIDSNEYYTSFSYIFKKEKL